MGGGEKGIGGGRKGEKLIFHELFKTESSSNKHFIRQSIDMSFHLILTTMLAPPPPPL